MSTLQVVFGVVCVLGATGAYHWITTINARVPSFAERVWPWVSLCSFALALISGFQGIKSLLSEANTGSYLLLSSSFSLLLLVCISYLAWMSALEEESD